MVRELSREPAMFQIGVQGEVLIFWTVSRLFLNSELSIPKVEKSRKIAAFSNRKVLKSQVLPQKSQKHRQKTAEQITEKSQQYFWGADSKLQRFRVFKIASFSGR